jgi:anti-sigma B factor antagonist
MASDATRLDVQTVDGVTVARFVDNRILDEAVIQVVGDQMYRLVDDHGLKRIVLDFQSVEHLSSAALGKLINMKKKVDASGGQLNMCNLRPDLLKIFKVTKLTKVFDIHKNVEKALKSF